MDSNRQWKLITGILVTLCLVALFFASQGMAQNRAIRGKVTDEQGQPIPEVKIEINGMDFKRNYATKTDKKGEYYHGGLQSGSYQVTAQKDGFAPEEVKGIRPPAGGEQEVSFKLKPGSGKLASQYTKEEIEKMKKDFEDAQKQAKAMGEVKTLFDEGLRLSTAKQYPESIAQFKQALEKGLDAKNSAVVWANIADAHSKNSDALRAKAQRDEAGKEMAEAIGGLNEAVKLDPSNAAYYQNLVVALGKAGKVEEAKQTVEKVNAMDPTKAGQNYFNLGAILVNTGRNAEAAEAFRQSAKSTPPSEEAYYQLGICLVSDPSKAAESIAAFQEYMKVGKSEQNKETARLIMEQLDKSAKEAATKKAAPPAKAVKSKKGS